MKKSIIGIVIGILIGTVSTVVASSYIAKSISYTPKDTSWGVDNVEAAIDSLYLSKAGDNYSTSEKVVGTWVDGKKIYQITYNLTTCSSVDTVYNLQNVSSLKIDNLIDIKANISSGDYFNVWYTSSDNYIKEKHGGSHFSSRPVSVTLQYTKTTD